MPQCPLPLRISGLMLGLCTGALFTSFASATYAGTVTASDDLSRASTQASELAGQPDADAAEAWLAHLIPVGTALADEPDFFADASEVFYDAEERLVVFVYRSATSGRWIAWVSFDSERVGVVHTAAIDL